MSFDRLILWRLYYAHTICSCYFFGRFLVCYTCNNNTRQNIWLDLMWKHIYLNKKKANFSFQVVEKNNDIRELPLLLLGFWNWVSHIMHMKYWAFNFAFVIMSSIIVVVMRFEFFCGEMYHHSQVISLQESTLHFLSFFSLFFFFFFFKVSMQRKNTQD